MGNRLFFTSWPVGAHRAIFEAFEFADGGGEPLIVVHVRFAPELVDGFGNLTPAEALQYVTGYDRAKSAAAQAIFRPATAEEH